MKHRILREVISEASRQILRDIAIDSGQIPALASLDRYLPMPKEDFRAMTGLATLESVPQFKAAVVSATALFKFKQNSSYFPEFCPASIQAGV